MDLFVVKGNGDATYEAGPFQVYRGYFGPANYAQCTRFIASMSGDLKLIGSMQQLLLLLGYADPETPADRDYLAGARARIGRQLGYAEKAESTEVEEVKQARISEFPTGFCLTIELPDGYLSDFDPKAARAEMEEAGFDWRRAVKVGTHVAVSPPKVAKAYYFFKKTF
jgi:hypothetical protein